MLGVERGCQACDETPAGAGEGLLFSVDPSPALRSTKLTAHRGSGLHTTPLLCDLWQVTQPL